jgi:hypothetical protein
VYCTYSGRALKIQTLSFTAGLHPLFAVNIVHTTHQQPVELRGEGLFLFTTVTDDRGAGVYSVKDEVSSERYIYQQTRKTFPVREIY